MKLFDFFFNETGDDKPFLKPENQDTQDKKFWQSLLMALAVAYYYRLPEERIPDFHQLIAKIFEEKDYPRYFSFPELVKEELSAFYDGMLIPAGVAKTFSMQVNLFCNVVGMQTRIPLLITGDPGRSKTLSFNISCDNMKGSRSKKETFRWLRNVNRFHYQCSEASTFSEINAVYSSAVESQKRFDEAQMGSEQCVVFLDEGGLPNERKHALKVFHYYADHPLVGTVILSNSTLDAAKTNRCIQVLLPKVNMEDLEALARGILSADQPILGQGKGPSARAREALIQGLSRSFSLLTSFTISGRDPAQGPGAQAFDMRDFVYFLRDIQRQLGSDPHALPTPEMLYHSLRRNFNGIHPSQFGELVSGFFHRLNSEMHEAGLPLLAPPEAPHPGTIQVLRESIEQVLVKEDEDPNQSSHRYVMVIDPAMAESSLNSLGILGIPANIPAKHVSLSDFPEDGTELEKSRQVSEVKASMELGETVFLSNSGPIQTNFYELFNRYFVSALGQDGNKQYYANVAIGAYSRPCLVHPRFQIVVIIPMEEFKAAPAPFRNRFEKYILSLEHAYLHHPQRGSLENLDLVHEGIKDFVSQCQPTSFYGFLEGETLYSLMVTILELTSRAEQGAPSSPLIPASFSFQAENQIGPSLGSKALIPAQALSAGEEEGGALPSVLAREMTSEAEQGENLRRSIRKANFFLMQIARPESIFLLRNFLPRAYLVEYLMKQEHFSFLNFFNQLLQFTQVPSHLKPGVNHKWVIYTRTSAEIYQISTDASLKIMLLRPLLLSEGLITPEQKEDEIKLPESQLDSLIAIITLANMRSAKNCEAEVEKFFSSPTQRVLLCVADMAQVTKLQVNFAKRVIDDCYSRDPQSRRVVIILVHVPSGKLKFSACYSSVFTHGWHF